jgi:hypothetical protein
MRKSKSIFILNVSRLFDKIGKFYSNIKIFLAFLLYFKIIPYFCMRNENSIT